MHRKLMLSGRIVTFGILIIYLSVSCRQGSEKLQSVASDSTTSSDVDTTTIDTTYTFDPDNEFLGIGVQEFGDLDSMIARRKIRALVPYTHLYYTIDGKERKGIAFEALNLFEKSLNEQLKFKRNKVRVIFIPVNRNQ